jgi:hypothetical protein
MPTGVDSRLRLDLQRLDGATDCFESSLWGSFVGCPVNADPISRDCRCP